MAIEETEDIINQPSNWAQVNLASLLPGPTRQILEGTGEAAKSVADAANSFADVVETIADILIDITDPMRAILEKLIDELRKLQADIMNTGLYLYYDASVWPWYQTRAFSFDEIIRYMDIDQAETNRRVEYQRRVDEAGEAFVEPYEPPQLPLTTSVAYGFSGWKKRWEESFYDMGDEQRPAFSDQAYVSCVIIIAGTPSFDALPALIKAIGVLLGIKPFERILDRLAITQLAKDAKAGDTTIYVEKSKGFRDDDLTWIRHPNAVDVAEQQFVTIRGIDHAEKSFALYDAVKRDFPAGTIVAMTGANPHPKVASVAPDWMSRVYIGSSEPVDPIEKGIAVFDEDRGEYFIPFRLGDLPPMRHVDRAMRNLIGMLELGDRLLALIQQFADALKEKAEQIRVIGQMIADIITLIEQILLLSGAYIIKLDSNTGPQGLVAQLDQYGPPPLPEKSFIVGACLLSGAPNFGPIAELFGA